MSHQITKDMKLKTQKTLNWFLIIITEILLCASLLVATRRHINMSIYYENPLPITIPLSIGAIILYLIIQKIFWGKKHLILFNIVSVVGSFYLLLYSIVYNYPLDI